MIDKTLNQDMAREAYDGPATVQVRPNPILLAAAGTAATLVGVFMPWAESMWMEMSGIQSPMGKILLLLGFVAGCIAYRLSTGARGGVALAVIGVVAGFVTFGTIWGLSDDEFAMISIGTGVYVSAAGAVLLVLGGLQAANGRRLGAGTR